ncbi:uncharacterized protein LOC125238740 [Leguminivora glycinivorella]|uniref:uncharacterized protein LOC125238740 n=1 Tax=Leguminivora glycinivorella TaxID=1035111 RepID=UPI00200EDA59|nr:uncharacterized protein LOC125238740 [Leguminivora glycinivorella]
MAEPEKPFACVMQGCGMTFTNEDHLHVHTKKHDMVLQLGMEQKAAFVADQTPTPTRFIRNCEEVGLFQDLQNVNPFDEGFKQAMEAKAGRLSLEGSDVDTLHTPHTLHTPQMFPLDGDASLYTNNQRNITISRSSSDESGAVKEYETTTISKLTNEVTTISRIVGKQDIVDKVTTTDDVAIVRHEDAHKEINETVSYTNNVIKIHSNVEIRKDGIIESKNIPRIIYTDSVIKDGHVTKDVLLADKPEKAPPIMSQKSLDFVVDSLEEHNDKKEDKQIIKMLKRNYNNALKDKDDLDDFEIIIKKPDGRQVRMKPVDDDKRIQNETKDKLKRVLSDKAEKKTSENKIDAPVVQNTILPISTLPGTLVPVTIVNPNTILITNTLQKIPIVPFNVNKVSSSFKKTVKRRNSKEKEVVESKEEAEKKKLLEPRTAASRRYRQKQKVLMNWQAEENRLLKETNHKLVAENAALKLLITEHLKKCSNPEDLKLPQAEHHTNR